MPLLYFFILLLFSLPAFSQSLGKTSAVRCGADQTEAYLPMLQGKRVAVMANQTSRVGNCHLVDTLVGSGIDVVSIFSAEHGFRGKEADGAVIHNGMDSLTGLPVISLYGKAVKPTAAQLAGIDLMVFDLQDVGVRFYTYISSLHYLMEACAENHIPLLILDRPNPNGNYIDGPILESEFSSFVGLHPVPVVHGMTMAEYARMINGEYWLNDSIRCDLTWIKCLNYRHSDNYVPPLSPSPNLQEIQAIRLYPSVAFFEGTRVSEGRGTKYPFMCYGYPGFPGGDFTFVPVPIPGVAENPKYKNQVCTGRDLRTYLPPDGAWTGIELNWLIDAYRKYENKKDFFLPYFDKLAGTDQLRKDIEAGLDDSQIKEKWAKGLELYTAMRSEYLLYE